MSKLHALTSMSSGLWERQLYKCMYDKGYIFIFDIFFEVDDFEVLGKLLLNID